jgi:Transposase and inactivated derivatives
MPWKVDPVTEQRLALVHSVRSAGLSIAEAARRFGVSRKTAHKWLARYDAEPERPLSDHSRRPHASPRRTSADQENAVLEVRDRWGWGPRKLHAVMAREGQFAPPVRTIAAILNRHGRTQPPPAEAPEAIQRFERETPNELWQLDFKGPLEVERRPVNPMTLLDDHSRYLLCLRPCFDMTYATVQAVLWEVFGEAGMPESILCDNAFAARNTYVGLSSFEAWLIRLGIRPAHGRAYHPQTQGKLERLHGTLESELWPRVRRDDMENFAADCENWRPIYNAIRPHEAIGDEPPVCRWRPSPRLRPAQEPEMSYPAGLELRVVGQAGDIRYRGARIQVGVGLAGERVHVEEKAGSLEVRYGSYRVRCLSLDLLSERRRL